MPKDTRRRFRAEARKFGPRLRSAFLQAIQDIAITADLRRLEQALEARDTGAVIELLELKPEFYAPLNEALRATVIGGGAYFVDSLPRKHPGTGTTLVIRFQGDHPRARRFIEQSGGDLITNIVEKQRAMVRSYLASGVADGRGPKAVALDLVGRVNRQTGRRTGGIIGLTERDALSVAKLRLQLLSDGRGQVFNRTGCN